jgi:hypothetical protein
VTDIAAASARVAERRAEQAQRAQDLADFDAEVAREAARPAAPVAPIEADVPRAQTAAQPLAPAALPLPIEIREANIPIEKTQQLENNLNITFPDGSITFHETPNEIVIEGLSRRSKDKFTNRGIASRTVKALIVRALSNGKKVVAQNTDGAISYWQGNMGFRREGSNMVMDLDQFNKIRNGEIEVYGFSEFNKYDMQPYTNIPTELYNRIPRPRAQTAAEPSRPAASPLQREPWQMTRDEFANSVEFVHEKGRRRLFVKLGNTMYSFEGQSNGKRTRPSADIINDIHRSIIQSRFEMLAQRDAVKGTQYEQFTPLHERNAPNIPAEVLADYPSLAQEASERGTTERLYSGLPLTDLVDAIKASDQAQYIRSAVTELGRRAYAAGKHTFGEWRAQLREWLGAAFDKVRPYLRQAWNAARTFAADESGSTGRGKTEAEAEQRQQALRDRLRARTTPTQKAAAAREQTDTLIQQKAGTQPGNVGQRPDLAKPSGDEVIRTAFDEIDEIRTAAGQPERKKQDKTRRDAANVVLANPKGTRLALMQKFNDGQTWTDDETAQAAVIINVPGTRAALLTGTPQIKQEVNDLINAYREQGTRGARAQAIRRDQFMTPEERANNYILQALTRPLKNGKQLTNEQRDNIVIQLKDRGVDLGSLTNQVLSDPVNVWNIIHAIQQERADNWDAMYEYWINGILSLPTTHMANVIGNTANTVIDMTLQRVVEAGLNSVARNPSAATFGEFREMQRVIAPAIRFATQNAIMAGRLQESYLEKWVTDNALAGGRAKFLEGGQSISGMKGRVFRAPGTALVIEDEFAKSFIARVQVAAEAYRSGKANGLSGQALTDHINEETSNTGSEAWRRAIEYAQELTFQKDTGKYVGILENARATFPPLKFLVPFVRTLVNVAKREAQMSVFGAPIMAVKYKQGKYEGEAGQQQAIRDASSTLIGIGLTGVMAAILSGGDDDELPIITGTRAYGSSQGERELENRTMPSMTVRIGNRQYSYARISPVSTSLALATDIGNMILGKEDIGNILQRIQQLIKDRTMMQGINDMITIFLSRNADQAIRNTGKFGANFVASWVPNIVRGAARNSDEFIRNDYIWGNWQEVLPRSARRVGSKIVSPSNLSYPMVDMWGRDVRRHTGISPYTDFVYDMFIPARGGEKIVEPVDMLIMRYNSRNPDEPYLPESPEPRVSRGGETVYMTDRQYYDMMKQSGALALQRINSYRDAAGQPLNYRNPTIADIEAIKKIRETANAEVGDSIMGAPASRKRTNTGPGMPGQPSMPSQGSMPGQPRMGR